jgi:hypothetical protein
MGVTYARGTDVARLDPVELSERLDKVIRRAVSWLVTLSDDDASVPEREGKWSAKEVVGHLMDSAVNNLARMVRMQGAEPLVLAGYEQEAWVRRQHYREREWSAVLGLWFALNEHVVWTVQHIDRRLLANEGVIEGDRLTLGYLVEDYIAHIEHHMRLLQAWVRPGLG